MNPEEFKNLYQCEYSLPKLPEEGYALVENNHHARAMAQDLDIPRGRWRYLSRENDLRGLAIPDRECFYFINWNISYRLVKERIKS